MGPPTTVSDSAIDMYVLTRALQSKFDVLLDSQHRASAKAVEAVLALRSLLDDITATVNSLEDKLLHKGQSSNINVDDVAVRLQQAREKQKTVQASLRRKSSALGVKQRIMNLPAFA